MSPSEKDLRASLQRGEGDAVDVDRIVAAGSVARSQRRNRLVAVAAAVVLVTAGASVTGVVLARDDGGGGNYDASADSAGGATAAASRAANPANPGIASGEPSPGSASSSLETTSPTAVPCPAGFPRRMLPGGGGPGQFGSDTPLFASDPVSITVCGYTSTGTASGRLVFTGRDATALRLSLESASRTVPSCPVIRSSAATKMFAFLAVDAAGRSLRVVTTTVETGYCLARTTNGTAVRFGWAPPESLSQRLAVLGVNAVPRTAPSGKVIGSPVR